MKINRDEVIKVANLARLNFNDEEINKLIPEISSILDYVEKLEELNLENIEPMSHVNKIINIYREDIIKKSLSRDEALLNSPDSENGCFKVSKVIEA